MANKKEISINLDELDLTSVYENEMKKVIKENKDKFVGVEDLTLKFYPTGNSILDNLLGGGLPQGKIVQFAGEPGVGKSTLAYNVARTALKTGASVYYIETEGAVTAQRLETFGLKSGENNFVVMKPESIEEFRDIIKNIMEAKDEYVKLNKNNAELERKAKTLLKANNLETSSKNIKEMVKKLKEYNEKKYKEHTIVILDSVTSLPVTTEEIDKNLVTGQKGSVANAWSSFFKSGIPIQMEKRNMSLILINQIRNKIEIGKFTWGGPKEITVGGKAINFAVFMDVRLHKKGTFSDKTEDRIVKITHDKNKTGGIEGTVIFLYKYGYSETMSVYYTLKDLLKVIDRNKIKWEGFEEETYKKDKFIKLFNTDLEFRKRIYNILETHPDAQFIINDIYKSDLLLEDWMLEDEEILQMDDQIIEKQIELMKAEEKLNEEKVNKKADTIIQKASKKGKK